MKELKEYYDSYLCNLTKLKSSNKTKLNILSRLKLELYFADRLLDKTEREEMENKISVFQTSLLNEKSSLFKRSKSR